MSIQPISKVASAAGLTPGEWRQYKVVCAALWCWYNREQLFYGGVRGKDLLDQCKIPPYVPKTLDCSGFCTYCFDISGCPDPNGQGFNGQASTGLMWSVGTLVGDANVKASALQPADLIFYAYEGPLHGGNSEHVAIYIDQGQICSMGSDEGPLILDYTAETKPLYGVRRYPF
jgi:hypothetical protein